MSDFRRSSSSRPTVYLAGPDVFLPDAVALGERKKEICHEHGFDAMFPLDVVPDSASVAPHELGLRIFDVCLAMMQQCDLAIAQLTPFRGVSMDVGTAVELGYMHARGKPVFGYTNVVDNYDERLIDTGLADERQLVEHFGFFDNLMCEGPVLRSGGEVVRFQAPPGEMFTALDGFTLCVQQARTVLRVA